MADTTFIPRATNIVSTWLNQINRYVFGGATAASLRSLDKTVYTRFRTLGYYVPGDGGAGDYYLDPNDNTSVDNGGSVFVAADGGRWKLTASPVVNPQQFGAKCIGSSFNDAPAVQAAISFASKQYPSNSWFDKNFAAQSVGSVRIVDFGGKSYYFGGTKVLVPTAVQLRGSQSTITGDGTGTCFESAYWNSGVLTSNIGTPAESQVLQSMKIQGFRFITFALALNMYDCGEGCSFEDLDGGSNTQFGIFDRCFYARFKNLHSNENVALAANSLPAIDFRDFVNVQSMDSIAVHSRILGIQFSGGLNGLAPTNISVEGCTTGVKFLGLVGPLSLNGWYLENITGTGLDFTDNSGHTVTIDNCFFNSCGIAIAGINMFGGKIGRGNVYQSCTTNVSITDTNSVILVEIPAMFVADTSSTVPTVPTGFSLASTCRVDYPIVVRNISLVAQCQSFNALDQFASLPYFGQSGHVTNQVAFSSVSSSGAPSTATVIVDTKITFDVYVMGIYNLKIVDGGGNTFINGRFYGTTVIADTAAGKTVVVSNNGGYVRLSISTFNTPVLSSTEGIVRMV